MPIPYGSWPSPITADLVADEATSYDAVQALGEEIYWLERRPAEHGRTALVAWSPGSGGRDALPPDFDVGTWVNEYGGGAYIPSRSGILACNSDDDRIYRRGPAGDVQPITPASGGRFADLCLSPDERLLACVREHQPDGTAINDLVAVPADGSRDPWTLAEGHDFFSSPRFSPDGRWLAWTTADLPNMPWDGGRLWLAEFSPDGRLGNPQLVAGGDQESVFQPEWSPDGRLYFVSDRSGWWNLYRRGPQQPESVLPMDAEFGEAQWEFGYSTYAFLDRRRIAARYRRGVTDRIAVIDTDSGAATDLDLPVASIKPYVRTAGQRMALIGSSPTAAPRVMTYDLTDGALAVLAKPPGSEGEAWLSVPEEIAVRTADGAVAHALYYPPTNREVDAPLGDRPPLIVHPHPGPTSAAGLRLDLRVQYFTSRGFAVVAVNYRGSTGYGRAYRESLAGRWGIADAEDCIAVARHVAETKRVDPRRIAIAGASAGGFTALNAAGDTGMFAAVVSTFGITDLESHRLRSPRFQAYKLDRLIGPYPAEREEYLRRSPVYHAGRIRCPVLLMHGLSDSVVPPSHSRSMARALHEARVPYAHYEFQGEGHGFGRPEAIRRALELELSFYGMTLGLRMPDHLPAITLYNHHVLEERSVGL